MRKTAAFSLIEMLVALFIFAIFLAFSLPSFNSFHSRVQAQVFQSQLLYLIQLAEREAMMRRTSIVLCKSRDAVSCSGHWEDGQLVFMNEKEDGVVANEKQIIYAMSSGLKQGKIAWRSFPRYRDYLLFSDQGRMRNDNATFWYCNNQKHPIWALFLSKSGRSRIVYPDKNGCIYDVQGELLKCE